MPVTEFHQFPAQDESLHWAESAQEEQTKQDVAWAAHSNAPCKHCPWHCPAALQFLGQVRNIVWSIHHFIQFRHSGRGCPTEKAGQVFQLPTAVTDVQQHLSTPVKWLFWLSTVAPLWLFKAQQLLDEGTYGSQVTWRFCWRFIILHGSFMQTECI